MRHAYVLGAVALCIVIASLISPGHAVLLALGLAAGPWLSRKLRSDDSAAKRAPNADAGGTAPAPVSVLDAIDLPVITLDARAIVTSANAAALQRLPTLQAGQPLSFGIRDPQVLDAVNRVVSGGGREDFAYTERGGVERHYICTLNPLGHVSPPAAPSLTVLTLREISQERAVEATRIDFVANASHELRTPLASVIGLIETVQGSAKNDSAMRDKFMDIMLAQARRMARLVDDLLSLSRITLNEHNAPTSVVDMAEIAGQTVLALGEFARERGVDLSLDITAASSRVVGDKDELTSVLDNLIENAIKYGRSGKRAEVTLTDAATERELAIAVRDYGPGIPPEHVPRLTERFYRVDTVRSRSEGGTGLGLALVKHTINRHRGRLTIRSAVGEGSTFSFTLPRAAETVIKP